MDVILVLDVMDHVSDVVGGPKENRGPPKFTPLLSPINYSILNYKKESPCVQKRESNRSGGHH